MRWLLAAVLAGGFVAVSAAAALAAEVTLTPDGFEPEAVTVAAGTTVVWRNGTARPHTIRAQDGSWDSGPVSAGASFSVRMRTQGAVDYATADGAFAGTVIVTAAGADAIDDTDATAGTDDATDDHAGDDPADDDTGNTADDDSGDDSADDDARAEAAEAAEDAEDESDALAVTGVDPLVLLGLGLGLLGAGTLCLRARCVHTAHVGG